MHPRPSKCVVRCAYDPPSACTRALLWANICRGQTWVQRADARMQALGGSSDDVLPGLVSRRDIARCLPSPSCSLLHARTHAHTHTRTHRDGHRHPHSPTSKSTRVRTRCHNKTGRRSVREGRGGELLNAARPTPVPNSTPIRAGAAGGAVTRSNSVSSASRPPRRCVRRRAVTWA